MHSKRAVCEHMWYLGFWWRPDVPSQIHRALESLVASVTTVLQVQVPVGVFVYLVALIGSCGRVGTRKPLISTGDV